MSLSDCPRCWDTPCTCGYEYKNWSKEARLNQASVILGIHKSMIENAIGRYIPDIHPSDSKEYIK